MGYGATRSADRAAPRLAQAAKHSCTISVDPD